MTLFCIISFDEIKELVDKCENFIKFHLNNKKDIELVD